MILSAKHNDITAWEGTYRYTRGILFLRHVLSVALKNEPVG